MSKVSGCYQLAAGIDVASRYHVAAECGQSIRYFLSNPDGSWTGTLFNHPAKRQDLDPQLAFRGTVVFVAFSRIAPDGGCGGAYGTDVGVYYRTKNQPGGTWSDPIRIGPPGDHLQAFRVDGETIHAIVRKGGVGPAYYETQNGSSYHRYLIPQAFEETSLRIGSDGLARIAYPTPRGIRYAVFNGSGFSSVRIPVSTKDDSLPALALDSANRPHIVWTRHRYEPAACGPSYTDIGTYYATDASGTWTAHRITPKVGEVSLQYDVSTGRPHVLVTGRYGLWYYTTTPSGQWTETRVVHKRWPSSPVLRLDPATGNLLAVYLITSDTGSTRIYALTGR